MANEVTLKEYIDSHKINCELLEFKESCHTVKEAALAVKGNESDFVKNICIMNEKGKLVVAIINGKSRVDLAKVAKVTGTLFCNILSPKEVLEKTTYPIGGVPSFGFEAEFLIDEQVLDKKIIYSGGGSTHHLVKISPSELKKANKGKICDIRK
jgi:prolyl-tRNA editing enzyme YbaK/EbsC (Cys-tRNA(Pro) deacylase)